MEPQLPKGITKRGKSFRVSVMVAGERKTSTCKTLDEAIRVLEAFRLGIDTTEAINQYKTWTLGKAWEAYVDYRVAASTKTTVNEKKFKWYGKVLLGYFGSNILLDEINTRRTAEFHDFLVVQQQYSASCVNYFGSLLHQMQLFAHKRGRRLNPPTRMQSKKVTKGRVRFLTDEEELRALDWFTRTGHTSEADLFVFYIDTGFRKSEAFNLRFSDLDLQTGRITVWENKTDYPRTVKMTSRVRAIITRLYSVRRSDTQKVFEHISERNFYRTWIEMRDALHLSDDKQFVIHMLRHTCCTRLLGAGVDIRSVMQWMGHKSLEMTQRYAHFIPSKLDDAAFALDRLSNKEENEKVIMMRR